MDCILPQLLKIWDSHKGLRDTTYSTDVSSSCLILHRSECPLKVILFFNPLHSNHNFRGLATDEDIIHHSADTLPECFRTKCGGFSYLSLKNHTVINTHTAGMHILSSAKQTLENLPDSIHYRLLTLSAANPTSY